MNVSSHKKKKVSCFFVLLEEMARPRGCQRRYPADSAPVLCVPDLSNAIYFHLRGSKTVQLQIFVFSNASSI